MSHQLLSKSISEVAPLIQAKEVSPVELTSAILERITEKNKLINAYVDIYAEETLEQAARAEQEIMNGNYRSPLHGIPLGIKDNLYIKGKRITIGSKIHHDFRPTYDATVVAKLKNAGAIILGTLNMHEYAWGVTTNNPHYGPCRNPWDINRIPGGSSGGSAAAVAADLAMATLGSETAGSLRAPAAVCGIVSIKPTYGLVSKHGCFPLAWTLDHVGPMTKTVADSALMLEYTAGYDEQDPASVNHPVDNYTGYLSGEIKDLNIGIQEDYFFHDLDPEVERLVREGIKCLENRGAKIVEVEIPSIDQALHALRMTIAAESTTIHHENLLSRSEDFGADVRAALELGKHISAVEYLQAQLHRDQLRHEFKHVFKKVDVLVAPTTPITAAPIGKDKIMLNGREVNLGDHAGRLARPISLTGLPALSIPCGLSEAGLPVGLQIIGAPFQEGTILKVGKALEELNLLKGEKPRI